MTPDKIAIIVALCFIGLLFTHYLALKIGWNMGTKTDSTVLLSTAKKTKSEPYTEKPDVFDEQRLDFE